MKISFQNGKWLITREETDLDRFVKDFVSVLDAQKVKYVLVSGYVAILFGRSRNSEDVDFFIERLGYGRFLALWNALCEKFEPIITDDPKDAYETYLCDRLSIRFSRPGKFLPNAEAKFPKYELDEWSLESRIEADLNGTAFWISPLEVQLAYKLYLGSFKDFEDAKHLWLVCRERINPAQLEKFTQKLRVEKLAREMFR